jgi:hypothetical protein
MVLSPLNSPKSECCGTAMFKITPKWDLIKLQSFCKAKDTVSKSKRPPADWERISTNPTSNRGLISNIYI